MALGACAAHTPQRPAPAPKQAQKERTPRSDQERERQRLDHVAPPPAYGNKMVLAEVAEAKAPALDL